jgi:hypothetical protein
MGDTIRLAAGATFTGNYVLPNKTGSGVITIRSAASDTALPAAGIRIDPSNVALLPKLQSPNSMPALSTAPGAHGYTVRFVEFLANWQGYYDVITLGDGSSAQNTLAVVPHDLIIDACYIHGDPTYGQKRGIALNSASTSIINSYIAEIKAVGQDSQAIGGWNGPGPFTITNNYLEAAGENILFGGADPRIPSLIPSDITIRRNHFTKQVIWQTQGNWSVKNLLELKNAQRVVIDGNLMEYEWPSAYRVGHQHPGHRQLSAKRHGERHHDPEQPVSGRGRDLGWRRPVHDGRRWRPERHGRSQHHPAGWVERRLRVRRAHADLRVHQQHRARLQLGDNGR